ncbi:MAG: Rho termination factor N-terminal domain-containing protein [Ilumatobacteraceae bacterium]
MAAEALEQSMLESKDKDQLMAIAQALGIKTTARSTKSTIIGKILETTGAGPSAPTNGAAPAAPAVPVASVAEVGASGRGRSGERCESRRGAGRHPRGGRGRARSRRRAARRLGGGPDAFR